MVGFLSQLIAPPLKGHTSVLAIVNGMTSSILRSAPGVALVTIKIRIVHPKKAFGNSTHPNLMSSISIAYLTETSTVVFRLAMSTRNGETSCFILSWQQPPDRDLVLAVAPRCCRKRDASCNIQHKYTARNLAYLTSASIGVLILGAYLLFFLNAS